MIDDEVLMQFFTLTEREDDRRPNQKRQKNGNI